MANHLEHMAGRLESDPFFVACPLRLYQNSEGLDEAMLAAALHCSREVLVSLRLCRCPAAEDDAFRDDIERIAVRFGASADALAEAVRRGQALFHMARDLGASATLRAARDRGPEAAGDDGAGGDA